MGYGWGGRGHGPPPRMPPQHVRPGPVEWDWDAMPDWQVRPPAWGAGRGKGGGKGDGKGGKKEKKKHAMGRGDRSRFFGAYQEHGTR